MRKMLITRKIYETLRNLGVLGLVVGMFIIGGVVCGDADYAYAADIPYVFNRGLFITGIIVTVLSGLTAYWSQRGYLWSQAEIRRMRRNFGGMN